MKWNYNSGLSTFRVVMHDYWLFSDTVQVNVHVFKSAFMEFLYTFCVALL